MMMVVGDDRWCALSLLEKEADWRSLSPCRAWTADSGNVTLHELIAARNLGKNNAGFITSGSVLSASPDSCSHGQVCFARQCELIQLSCGD